MVQVHGDRMCGSFSSSVFNHRTDAYGGSATDRARFAVEAVSAVRRRLPNLPIDYKLAVRQEEPHYGNAGVLVEELPVFVPLLEGAGVTSFHVTLANHGELSDTIPPRNHPEFGKEGCFLKFCDQVRKLTSCPKAIDAPETRKILLPHEGLEELGTRRVMWSDLDGNGHVYSGNYGDFVWDYLPADLQEQLPKEFFINYSKEATLGQELRMVGIRQENEYLMEGLGPEGVCFSAQCVF